MSSKPKLQEDGDFILAQGTSIVQYVAKKLDLWPTDLKLSALSLSIILAVEDGRIKLKIHYK